MLCCARDTEGHYHVPFCVLVHYGYIDDLTLLIDCLCPLNLDFMHISIFIANLQYFQNYRVPCNLQTH